MYIPPTAYTQRKGQVVIGGIQIKVQERLIAWANLKAFGLQLATPQEVEALKRVCFMALGHDVLAFYLDRDLKVNVHGCSCDCNEEVTDETKFTPLT